MHSKLVRTPALYLVGFMGSGKSTVGRLLADDLGWSFVDLDDEIEAEAKVTITEIFQQLGEPEFRKREHEALQKRVRKVQCGVPMVISLGGGAYTAQANVEMVADNGVSIWLDCPLERVRNRTAGQQHRPLARDPQRFEQLYHERIASYAQADYRIAIDSDDPMAAVREILQLPLF
ncbi:MAG: shikimate kinase [Acidimicrobiia bacterium]|nr:shikimate kinase [Acidimicrobiia bacterium]